MVIKQISSILLLLLLTSSCGDKLGIGSVLPLPNGRVEASLIVTRATEAEEEAFNLDNVWVLVFDADNQLAEAPILAIHDGDNNFMVKLEATTDARTLYVLANPPATTAHIEAIAVGTHYNELAADAAFQTPSLISNMVVDGATPIPMFSQPIQLTDGTADITDLTARMERIVAKIEVVKEVGVTNFDLTAIALVNGAKQGHLFKQTLVINRGGTQRYDEGLPSARPIYLHENSCNPNNPTTLVVKGRFNGSITDTYYRVDIARTDVSQPYPLIDIERNRHYTVVIIGVDLPGYSSYNEALEAPATNIRYEIRVSDDSSHDLTDNGQYYLGLSNAEFIVYGTGELSGLVATTLATNAPDGVTSRTLRATAGITVMSLQSHPIDPALYDLPTDPFADEEVVVSLSDDFNSGNLTIQLGNLTKVIPITRRPELSTYPQVVSDFASREYVFATKESGLDPTDWLRFSLNAEGTNATDQLESHTSGIYIVTTRYEDDQTATTRTCNLYLARRTVGGRVKVHVRQTSLVSTVGVSTAKEIRIGPL